MLQRLQHRLAHQPLLDRYFRSRTDGRDTQLVLRRMSSCDACRVRYQRYLRFERLRPGGDELRADRLWLAIRQSAAEPVTGQAPAKAATPRRTVWAISAFAATAAVVLLIRGPFLSTSRLGHDPVARGAGDGWTPKPSIYLYRSTADNRSEPVGTTIRADDGILIAYSNPAPELQYLLIFAVDDQKRMHWYFPAYESHGVDPVSISIRSGALGVELGEEVRHSLQPGPLRLFAVFLPRQRHVLETEALVRQVLNAGTRPATTVTDLPIPGAAVTSQLIEVTP